jgi:hypothetical protein
MRSFSALSENQPMNWYTFGFASEKTKFKPKGFRPWPMVLRWSNRIHKPQSIAYICDNAFIEGFLPLFLFDEHCLISPNSSDHRLGLQ